MSYCVKTDILKQLDEDIMVQLTDDDDLGVVDDDVVTQAIVDADAEIDSYCGTRYDVPLSPVPPIILKRSVDLAICNLYARRRGVPEARQERCKEAIAWLVKIATGKATLGADAPAADSDGGPEASTPKSDRIFSTGKTSAGSTGSLDNY